MGNVRVSVVDDDICARISLLRLVFLGGGSALIIC
jgi:hypothetical protein